MMQKLSHRFRHCMTLTAVLLTLVVDIARFFRLCLRFRPTLDQRAHLRRNIRLQVTLFSTISCMAMEKQANVIDLILTVL